LTLRLLRVSEAIDDERADGKHDSDVPVASGIAAHRTFQETGVVVGIRDVTPTWTGYPVFRGLQVFLATFSSVFDAVGSYPEYEA
jgi:hypothetical protein